MTVFATREERDSYMVLGRKALALALSHAVAVGVPDPGEPKRTIGSAGALVQAVLFTVAHDQNAALEAVVEAVGYTVGGAIAAQSNPDQSRRLLQALQLGVQGGAENYRASMQPVGRA